MDPKIFSNIVDDQFVRCARILHIKDPEYSTEQDRLHNFKKAAHLQGITPRQALAGMMAKHTVSIYDMLMDNTCYPEHIWDEKITDHINYLMLLKGILTEENIGGKQLVLTYENFDEVLQKRAVSGNTKSTKHL